MYAMVVTSYVVNLAVLGPLLTAFARKPTAMKAVFGDDSDARRILVSVYAAIAGASIYGLAQGVVGHREEAEATGLRLFSLQIAYKLLTVPLVGIQSPVVRTNLAVVAVHATTVGLLLKECV